MKLNFRQGIVRHQTDGLGSPTFLDVAGGYVSLIVSPDPTIITFAHGEKNYLFTEQRTIPNAWGPFAPGPDQWLYWNINLATGVREFGSTSLEPVVSAISPQAPVAGQMWFNTIDTTWYEWSGSSWVEVVRAFACRLENGITPVSMSINAPKFTGTQVGITGAFKAGSLVFDQSGKPIRSGDRKFFTTEDIFITGVPTGASLRVNNILMPGIAQEPLASYSVVEYYDYNKLIHASPYSSGNKILGFVEEDADTGDLVNFVTEGIIYNDDWDWIADGADVNDYVYNDNTGLISLTPEIPNQIPVGIVSGRHEILFSPKLFILSSGSGGSSSIQSFIDLSDTPTEYTGSAGLYPQVNPLENGLIFSPITISWGDITGSLPNQLDLQTALDSKSDVGHTHSETDITDLDKYSRSEITTFLSTKSDINHTHNISDVLGLQSSLDSKVETGANVGTGVGIFRDKTGTDINLKSLVAGSNITLTDNGDDITIDATDTGEANTATNVGTGTGLFRDKTGVDINLKSLVAGSNITLTDNGDDVTIDAAGGGGGGGTLRPVTAVTDTMNIPTPGYSAVGYNLSVSPPSEFGEPSSVHRLVKTPAYTLFLSGIYYFGSPAGVFVYDHNTSTGSFVRSAIGSENYYRDVDSDGTNYYTLGNNILYYTTTPTGSWNQNPLPSGLSGIGLATDGTTVVVVGATGSPSAGAIFTTTDNGAAWTDRTPAAGLPTFSGVKYGNGIFVAWTNGSDIWTSPDGISWTLKTVPSSNSFSTIEFVGSNWIWTVRSDHNVYYSPDNFTTILIALTLNSPSELSTPYVYIDVNGTDVYAYENVTTNSVITANIWQASASSITNWTQIRSNDTLLKENIIWTDDVIFVHTSPRFVYAVDTSLTSILDVYHGGIVITAQHPTPGTYGDVDVGIFKLYETTSETPYKFAIKFFNQDLIEQHTVEPAILQNVVLTMVSFDDGATWWPKYEIQFGYGYIG